MHCQGAAVHLVFAAAGHAPDLAAVGPHQISAHAHGAGKNRKVGV